MVKIRFKDKVLSSMLLQTFRTHLPMFSSEEKKDTIVVSSAGGHSVTFKIVADEIMTEQPVFSYDSVGLHLLIWLLGLPLCVITFFYLNVPQWLLQVVLPTVFVLRYFYNFTYKRQFADYLQELKFYDTVTKVLAGSYLGVLERPEEKK